MFLDHVNEGFLRFRGMASFYSVVSNFGWVLV
jgi:hypothetical protein